jgi:hypothetical protein
VFLSIIVTTSNNMKNWSVVIFVLLISWSAGNAQQTDSTGLVPQQRDEVVDVESSDSPTTRDAMDKDEADTEKLDKAAQAGRTMDAQMKDEKLESKEGPDGEPIFINAEGKYYYINRKGQKIFIDKTEMRAR